jgi:NAD(P)-dependent dehydrogenase (short-subunit alcohol dehydrogenase family)
MMRLQDKVVLVTGGARGVGLGIARRLVREGAQLILADRDASEGEKTAASLGREFGRPVRFIPANVGYEDQVIRMVGAVDDGFGKLDVLVNNAQGFNGIAPVTEKTTGEFDYSLRTGFYASFWAMRSAVPLMRRAGGGSIINLTSLDGECGEPLLADYDVAKEAIRALSKVAARELGQYQIRVNSIAPMAETLPMTRSDKQWPGFRDRLINACPLGRIGDPEDDIGGVALFLASDDSRYVTGMTIFADGGLFLCPARTDITFQQHLDRPKRELAWLPA